MHRPIGRNESANAGGGGDDYGSSGIECPQPLDIPLLDWLSGALIGGVVGLHGDYFGAPSDHRGEDIVVGDLEADGVAHHHPPDGQHSRLGTSHKVPRHTVEASYHGRQLITEREELPEGHGVHLDVAFARSGYGIPHDSGILDFGRIFGGEHRTDKHRCANRLHCIVNQRCGRWIAKRINIGAIFWPDDKIWLRLGASIDGSRECQRLFHMVEQDYSIFRHRVHARTGCSSLHDGHCCRGPFPAHGQWARDHDDRDDDRRRDERNGEKSATPDPLDGQYRECYDQKGHAGHARDPAKRTHRRVTLREGDLSPRKTTYRNTAAQRFHYDPRRRDPQHRTA